MQSVVTENLNRNDKSMPVREKLSIYGHAIS